MDDEEELNAIVSVNSSYPPDVVPRVSLAP
jgi:hypothetical protein